MPQKKDRKAGKPKVSPATPSSSKKAGKTKVSKRTVSKKPVGRQAKSKRIPTYPVYSQLTGTLIPEANAPYFYRQTPQYPLNIGLAPPTTSLSTQLKTNSYVQTDVKPSVDFSTQTEKQKYKKEVPVFEPTKPVIYQRKPPTEEPIKYKYRIKSDYVKQFIDQFATAGLGKVSYKKARKAILDWMEENDGNEEDFYNNVLALDAPQAILRYISVNPVQSTAPPSFSYVNV
jgi:hypothetical protein